MSKIERILSAQLYEVQINLVKAHAVIEAIHELLDSKGELDAHDRVSFEHGLGTINSIENWLGLVNARKLNKAKDGKH